MKTKTVVKTSVFQANKEEVFSKLQKMETLQYIAAPYVSFVPENGLKHTEWKEGAVFSFRIYLFGKISLGIHKIHVITFDKDLGISTRENNKHIPIWNHKIFLEPVKDKKTKTRYTDVVEIGAGRKTALVALWAKVFYAHRQRKWKKLLKTERN
ncbi:MAG: hypothetical protein GX362_01860 [Methanosarcinaceae archaeon]|nr:hypothetical protein [Methanosarcinaceae archaeon]